MKRMYVVCSTGRCGSSYLTKKIIQANELSFFQKILRKFRILKRYSYQNQITFYSMTVKSSGFPNQVINQKYDQHIFYIYGQPEIAMASLINLQKKKEFNFILKHLRNLGENNDINCENINEIIISLLNGYIKNISSWVNYKSINNLYFIKSEKLYEMSGFFKKFDLKISLNYQPSNNLKKYQNELSALLKVQKINNLFLVAKSYQNELDKYVIENLS